jgi:PAS domain S-box-containing protein
MHIYGFPAVEGEINRDKVTACIIDQQTVKAANDNLINFSKEYNIEFTIRPADGSPVKYISAFAEMEKNELGEPTRIVGTLQDITQRKKAKEEIAKISRLYAVISRINQAIVRTTDETTLFKEACRIAVEDGQFKMAWIGMTDPETNTVNPVMFAGAYSDYFNKTIPITAEDIPGGRGPTGRAVSDGKYAICNDIASDPAMAPWKNVALSKGFLSSMAIPIVKFGQVVGAFTFYAPVKNFFDAAEVNLLQGATRDVAFAMENIEKEELRKNAENAIIKEKELSDSIINSLPGVFYLYNNAGKFLRWNKNFEQVTMCTPEEIVQMHPLDFFDAVDKALIAEKIANTWRLGEDAVQADLLLKTGEKIPYYFTARSIEYEGGICLAGVGIDFTERTKAQEEIKQTTEKLRRLTDHLQNIREEERKKIGREIHDELGQQLTAINMDVAWIDKKIPEENVPVKTKLKNIIQLLNGSNQSVRRILSELRPLMLDNYGLLDAVAKLAKQFTEKTGIHVQFLDKAGEVNITEQVANCIFRACQEAFTNITRYAHASRVIVSVDKRENNIHVTIEDDGAGFDIASIGYGKSFGILGMKERVISLGGIFNMTSVAGKGTKIALSLPLKNKTAL